MNNWVDTIFPLIIYALLSILLIALIILIINLIKTIMKVNKVVDDVNYKASRLNGLFDIIDMTTDSLVSFNDKIISFVSNGIVSFFTKKTKKKKKGEEENE